METSNIKKITEDELHIINAMWKSAREKVARRIVVCASYEPAWSAICAIREVYRSRITIPKIAEKRRKCRRAPERSEYRSPAR